MTKWILRVVAAAALITAAIWIWHTLFPGPEQVIRKRLAQLAKTASSNSGEGAIAKASRAQSLTTFFTPDVEITVDVPELNQSIHGTAELMQLAMAARSMGRSIKVDLLDISVIVAPDKLTAVAHMTGEAKISGESTLQVQELRAHFTKVQRDWLIDKVETVRTLR